MQRTFCLKEYSLLAFVVLLNNEAESEVVYTDIEPDIALTENSDFYSLDMDNNGTEDFVFNKQSGATIWWTPSGSDYQLNFLEICRVQPHDSLGLGENKNQIAGYSFSTYFSYYAYWPFALTQSVLINNSLDFNNGWGQKLARRKGPYPDNGEGDGYGYWWPSMEDHYLGVQFIDAESNYHFGWVRCSVLDSAEVLIIKDYAYETEMKHPIVAGDTVSYVDINDPENSLDATVYSFNRNIYIYLPQFSNSEIIISDMWGKKIIQQEIKKENEIINLQNESPGLYIVTLLRKHERFVKKVVIE